METIKDFKVVKIEMDFCESDLFPALLGKTKSQLLEELKIRLDRKEAKGHERID